MQPRISTRLQVRVIALYLSLIRARSSSVPVDRTSMVHRPIHSGPATSLVPELLIAVFCFLGMTIFLHV